MSEDREKELKEMQEKADAENKTRSGVGTRVRVGQTRGKASMVISWEAFDTGKPETLPKSGQQFMEVTGINDPEVLTGYLIDGYNDAQYTAASDPIAEFVNDEWDVDTRNNFRLVVRNYAKGAEVSIEEAVAVIKPGVEKSFAKKQAAAKAVA